jgi:hypothetical protein
MRKNPLLLTALLAPVLALRAAVPPAEKLLPADTLAFITVPDARRAADIYRRSPAGQLWDDPAMKAFKDKFTARFKEQMLTPLERELGVTFADYADLLQGQFTLALTRSGWEGKTNQLPGWMILMDTRDQKAKLTAKLAEVKKKWIDAGRTVKPETIRGLEFTTLILSSDDLGKTLDNAWKDVMTPPPAGAPAGKKGAESRPSGRKLEITLGQSDSLLLIGSVPAELEKVLIRQAGGLLPALAENSDFEANYNAMFREAFCFGWANFKPVNEILAHQAKGPAAESRAPANPLMPRTDKLLGALGLDGLKTLAFHFNDTPEGSLVNLYLGVPESNRRGVFKLLVAEAKESAPPGFVPADAVKFNRWRLDGKKLWASLEGIIAELSPELNGILQMALGAAGKDKDENFDLKKMLIGNLGDDFITFEKAPRSASLQDLASPPALYLVGSPNAEQLTLAIKTGATLLPPPLNTVTDREFLGRKIYAMKLNPAPNPAGRGPVSRTLHFSHGGGYVAFSSDVAMLEEFLRAAGSGPRPLRETAGLAEAAQKVGGLSTGWFAYENQGETFRAALEAIKQSPENFNRIFAGATGAERIPGAQDSRALKEWFDASLLPAYDAISKYFHFTVAAGAAQPDGLVLRTFFPLPPSLKK